MNYQSKYYNLDSIPQGWRGEDFAWVVEKLETMPKERLLELCRLPYINLRFLDVGKKEIESAQEIIAALLSDFSAGALISAIKQLTSED